VIAAATSLALLVLPAVLLVSYTIAIAYSEFRKFAGIAGDLVNDGALGEYDVGSTAQAVKAIVEAEGPIHRELLERRLVDNSDVERRGDNIKTTIEKGIQNATQRGTVWQEGSFYYPADGTEVVVRRRDGDAANINWVPEVEIEAAIKRILENQHATARDDLISQTATVLGFERTGERIAERVGSVIDDMRQSDTLEQSDGLLGLASVR